MDSNNNTGSMDPARKYGKNDPVNRNKFTCTFCQKECNGGACRMKQHLVGGFRNVKGCPKCPEHVKVEVKEYMMKKTMVKQGSQMLPTIDEYDEDDEEDCEVISIKRAKGSFEGEGSRMASKKPRQKGPIDVFFAPRPEDILKGRKSGKQQTINEVCKKELRNKACKEIARWFYDAAIPFNAATYDSFHVAMEAVAQFGPGFQPPSMHELRVPLLKQEVEDTEVMLKEYKKEWALKGCSILSDG